jgi:adenosylmethionine-8-amino-7-oxononanoate aminotransferase
MSAPGVADVSLAGRNLPRMESRCTPAAGAGGQQRAGAECIGRLRDDFARLGTGRTAAVLVEGVGGAGSGVLVPSPGYLEELRRLGDASGILWICDEVMSGFARTGRWFSFQHANAVPDIVTVAKGAGGGAMPLGGAAISGHVWQQISRVHPAMPAGHTFTNAPLACAAERDRQGRRRCGREPADRLPRPLLHRRHPGRRVHRGPASHRIRRGAGRTPHPPARDVVSLRLLFPR